MLFAGVALGFWLVWTWWPNLTAGAGGNDALFLADGARRIAAGQAPHVDFSLPTGVEPYLSYFWAEQLLAQMPPYIGSQLVGFCLLAPLLVAAGATFERRLVMAAFFCVAALAALFPFNTTLPDFYGVSFHASYNRLGSAVALVIFAWIFRADAARPWLNGLLIAYALSFAFFLKIVFVGVVLAPVVVLALCDAAWRRAGVLGVGSFAAVLAATQLTTGLPLAYLADIRSMAAINAGTAPYFLASFVFRTFALQLLVWTLIAWALFDKLQEIRGRGEPLWSASSCASLSRPVAMAAAVAALIFAESQATHGIEFAGVIGVLLSADITGRPGRGARMAVAVAALTLSGGALAISAFENGMGAVLQRKGPAVRVEWVERYMPHTVVPAVMLDRAQATAALWAEGVGTLRTLRGSGQDHVDRSDPELYLAQWKTVDDALKEIRTRPEDLGAVATLSNVDLFGLALHAAPAKGLKVVHDVGRSIAPLTDAEARTYLAHADTVFEPTCALDEAPGFELMTLWFKTALVVDFSPHVLTPCWTMHRRKAK